MEEVVAIWNSTSEMLKKITPNLSWDGSKVYLVVVKSWIFDLFWITFDTA
jgi:hypothetical protein